MIAAQNEDEPMVEWLLSRGAHTYVKDTNGKCPINYARHGSKVYKMIKTVTNKENAARKIAAQNVQPNTSSTDTRERTQ